MQTITVKNIEQKSTKDGSKTFFIITDTTGASFSLWEPIGMIKTGCVLEVDVQLKGKFANIQNFKITSQPSDPQPNEARPPFQADPVKTNSIETQTAAKIAADLYIAGKLDKTGIVVQGLLHWLAIRLPPSNKGTGVDSPLVKKAKQLGAVEETATFIQRPEE